MAYLLDTNTVIHFLSKVSLNKNALKEIDSICSKGPRLSVISKLELLSYRFTEETYKRSVIKFVSSAEVFPISGKVEDETIKIRTAYSIKLPDAIIAATAITNKFTLISANEKDFKQIKHLKLINPFDW